LDHLFIEKHREWNLPPSMTSYTFLQLLLTRTHLSQLRLRSRHYSSLILYSWEGKASPLSVALRIKKHGAFFSHGSAMWIHGLNQNHKNIFINNEQSPKPKSSSYLSQEGIDRAFQNQQRYSKLFYKYQDTRITLINGKHSGRLEVQQSHAPSGHAVDVTSLERTLIDITVRPGYSSGVPAVLQAFRLARGRISVTKLLGILRKLDYAYLRPHLFQRAVRETIPDLWSGAAKGHQKASYIPSSSCPTRFSTPPSTFATHSIRSPTAAHESSRPYSSRIGRSNSRTFQPPRNTGYRSPKERRVNSHPLAINFKPN
jgi:hypothetical protein